MNICTYSYEEYLQLVKSFHGNLAPGLIIGGFIVDLALKHLPEGEFFDALCETPVCLPDAVQILTPCTIGNGWLTVLDFGRFAVTMYEKKSGRGVRVYLDAKKLENWPEVRDWYLKRKKKHEQDFELLLAQIKEAGHGLLGDSAGPRGAGEDPQKENGTRGTVPCLRGGLSRKRRRALPELPGGDALYGNHRDRDATVNGLLRQQGGRHAQTRHNPGSPV